MLEVKVAELRTGRRAEGTTKSTPVRRSPFMVTLPVVVVVEVEEAVVEVVAGEAMVVAGAEGEERGEALVTVLEAPRGRPLDMVGGDPGPQAFGAARHPLPVTLPPPAPPTPPTTPPWPHLQHKHQSSLKIQHY